MGLGEFALDGAADGENVFLFYSLFNFATFFIMIVFLNMLIAIMSDTFGRVTADREKFKRLTALSIMKDYIKLIDHEFMDHRIDSAKSSLCSD